MLGLAPEDWDVSVRLHVKLTLNFGLLDHVKVPRSDVHLLPHLDYVVVGGALSGTFMQGWRQVRILYLELISYTHIESWPRK